MVRNFLGRAMSGDWRHAPSHYSNDTCLDEMLKSSPQEDEEMGSSSTPSEGPDEEECKDDGEKV